MPEISSFTDIQEHFAEFFGRAASLYNINPLLGRLYGYLFLAPEPMTLDDLCSASGAAKSTVSVAIRSLEHYRLIRRQWQKGQRKDFFVPRTDTDNVLKELFQFFFSPELRYMQEANATAREALEAPLNNSDWPNLEQRRELLQRVEVLDALISLVGGVLEQLTGIASPKPSLATSVEIEVEE